MSSARVWLAGIFTVCAFLVLAPVAMANGTVTVGVAGKGDVTEAGGTIDCDELGGTCAATYADERVCEFDPETRQNFCFWEPPYVELTAGADRNGYSFETFTGCDDVTGRVCGMTVTADRSVTARFADVEAPSVSAPTPSSGIQRGSITIGASAGDNSGVVQRVEFRVRGTLVATDTQAPFSAAFNTATVADGAASITATAFDSAGRSSTGTSSVTIDNTAPTVSITGGPSGQTFGPGTTQTWTFSAADATSGVAAIECSVVASGAPASYGPCSGGSGMHAVSNRSDGSYTFAVRVRDNGGLLTTSAPRSFSIDATPPETTITLGPADGSSSIDTSVTFGFGSSESGSTFECRVYPAALTPPVFGTCSAASGHTASGFSPGTYAFEVAARDPYGNLDASPAKRTFTVIEQPTGGDTSGANTSGEGTGTGTGTAPASGGSGAGQAIVTVPAPPFDPRFSSAFSWKRSVTRFTKLSIGKAPAGSKVLATCKGKGCGFKRKAIRAGGSTVNVLKYVRRLRLRSGAYLQIRVTGPDGSLKVATWRIRKGKAPVTTYRCATPGGKLGRCA